jgi:ribose transport system permease protein
MIVRRVVAIQEAGMLLALLALCAVILLSGQDAREAFLGPSNLQNVSRRVAMLALFAIGETLVIIAAGIDLSLGSLIAAAGVLVAHLMVKAGVGMAPAMLTVLGLSGCVGCFHGLCVTKLRLQPFVVTLASMLILRGSAKLLSPNMTIPLREANFGRFNAISNGDVAGIPVPCLILVGVAVPAVLLLRSTPWGRQLFALGGNEEAARLSGVNVHAIKIGAYCLCSALGGLSGMLDAALNRVGDPRAGVMYELRAIAAAVIGGSSLMGGQGSVIGTIIGAGIFVVLYNGINLVIKLNASLWENVVVGGAVLLAVLLDVARRWWRQRG